MATTQAIPTIVTSEDALDATGNINATAVVRLTAQTCLCAAAAGCGAAQELLWCKY